MGFHCSGPLCPSLPWSALPCQALPWSALPFPALSCPMHCLGGRSIVFRRPHFDLRGLSSAFLLEPFLSPLLYILFVFFSFYLSVNWEAKVNSIRPAAAQPGLGPAVPRTGLPPKRSGNGPALRPRGLFHSLVKLLNDSSGRRYRPSAFVRVLLPLGPLGHLGPLGPLSLDVDLASRMQRWPREPQPENASPVPSPPVLSCTLGRCALLFC